ncbi:MAG: hypothetical protein ACI855_004867, partial [Myxococcota bacterium]
MVVSLVESVLPSYLEPEQLDHYRLDLEDSGQHRD